MITVGELLFLVSGSSINKYRITIVYNEWNNVVAKGTVDDIDDFNNIPYGEREVKHVDMDNGELVILI
jgi:hypothetical protein